MIARYDVWARPFGLNRVMKRMPAPTIFTLPRPARPAHAVRPAQPNALDVYFEGDRLIVKAQLPGFKPEEIDVQVQQGVLTIRAQANGEQERQDRGYVIRERRGGGFARSLRLPKNADIDAVEATYEHGILTLAFPKAAEPAPRRISVATVDQGSIDPAPSTDTAASEPVSSNEAAAASNVPATSSDEASMQPAGYAADEAEPVGEQATAAASGSQSRESSKKGAVRKTGSRKRAGKAPASV